MGMDKIGSFPSLGRRLLDRFQKTDTDVEPGTGKAGETPSGNKPANSLHADRAEISGKAREMIKLRDVVDAGRHAIEETPEVRPDRVAEVKSRLNRGYYQSVRVNDDVADRLEGVFNKIDDL